MSEPELLTPQEQLLRAICCELFSIWQEAKSNYPDNWNGVLYDALPDKHKWEYELTANRILAKCEASFPARIAEERAKLIKWLDEPCTEHRVIWETYQGSVNKIKDVAFDDDHELIWYFRHRIDCPQCWQSIKEVKP